MGVFSELHRRNVVRVGIAYTVTAWLLLQVADVVMENIGAPQWVMQALLFVLVVGAVPALLFAWVFELTPEGIKREQEVAAGESVVHQTRRKLDTVIIILLAGVVGYLVWETRLRDPAPETPLAAADGGEAAVLPPAPAAQDSPEVADYVPSEKSIAVLPFVNLSSDPEQEYFSDGISEELLNVLAQIPELRVAARTSSFQFKGDNQDISDIARQLNVAHVLEGSVRKAGTRLRITAQLIEADKGYHLWSNTYDRELADVFAIQDEISLAIADALRAELSLGGGGVATAQVAETSNTAAYEAFLKGRALINKRGNQAITEAVRELERSVLLDPDYAPARAQLAIGIAMLTNSTSTYGDLTLAEVNERAGEQLRIAESLDPDIAEVWAAKAVMANVNNREAEVVSYANRAAAVRPNYVDVLNWKVNSLAQLNRFEEAQETREYLLEIDPLSVIGRLNAVNSIAVSDPERAERIARSIEPQSAWASHAALMQVYAQTEEVAREVEQLLAAYALDAEDLLINYRLTSRLAEFGFADEAMRVDRDLRAWVDLALNRHAEAEAGLRGMLAADPEALELRTALADALYFQGKLEEASELWVSAMIETVHGPTVYSNGGSEPSLRLLHALRYLGRDADAETLRSTLSKTITAWEAAIGKDVEQANFSRGALAAMDGNATEMARWMMQAVEGGAYWYKSLDQPMFDPVRDSAELAEVRAAMRTHYDRHRAELLTLICRNNPVPDYWRPLESTCPGAIASAGIAP